MEFMFQLTEEEYEILRSQFATLENGRETHRTYLLQVFTEHGLAMLSSVLKGERAVEVNITIIRAFVKLREMHETNRELDKRIDQSDRL